MRLEIKIEKQHDGIQEFSYLGIHVMNNSCMRGLLVLLTVIMILTGGVYYWFH